MKDIDQLGFPPALRYAASHEWYDAATGRVGIADYAQDQLGDLTFVELPEVGRTVAAGEEFGTLESSKSVGELLAPIAGTIRAVNTALESDPGLVNREPYGEGWVVEIEAANPADAEALLNAEAYKSKLKN